MQSTSQKRISLTETTTVRRLRRDDHDAWLPLWHAYNDFYRHVPEPAVTERTFGLLCDGAEGYLGLCAETGGELVGHAHLIFHPSTWSPTGYCYLEDLFVAPAARGTGAGRALIDAAEAQSEAHGCDRLYWLTQEYNSPARSLYDTVGQLQSFRVYFMTHAKD
ncbi:MAG: hypothetical protein QOG77_3413 [Solirubrobacteraceae bacterium]|jgi:GNAT superfamily N-acetyltransferase|nr:hypothetical protein [Solirubrobacteraceae bacterium]